MDTATTETKPSVVQRLNLWWLHRLFTSSVGRKLVMGFTGLALCGFLVVHLAGNLLLYAGAERYDHYAHMLHEQEWLPAAEAGLFAMFLLHIYLACSVTLDNLRARNLGYAVKRTKQDLNTKATPHNWMFLSGAVVLGFLILHLVDLKFEARTEAEIVTAYDGHVPSKIAFSVLSNPISAAVYMLGTAVLGFHLWHGFSSAFQSLGLTHPKYTPLIKLVGVVFAVVLAAGFFSLPLGALSGLIQTASSSAVSAPVK